jgi:hypothetical protein
MKVFRWVLLIMAALVVIYPAVYIAGKLIGFPTLPMSKYYWVAIILVLGLVWWEEKTNKVS